jgi:rare lipoprotein A
MSQSIRELSRRYIACALAGAIAVLALAGCGSAPPAPSTTARAGLPALPPAGSGRGGYYMDDGPGDSPPDGLLDMPDAVPRIEAYSTRANRPYTVFGKTYKPFTDNRAYKQRGIGSWYGKKFHGQKTSSGELYDMYKMTAAHPTLPIPSYVRVTNLDNGARVIVRVNDRGPFHAGRIIDLSYVAALKLGYLSKGSGMLEVERLLPDEIERIASGTAGNRAMPATDDGHGTPAVEALPVASRQAAVTVLPVTFDPVPQAQSTETAPASSAPAAGFYLQLGAFAQADNAYAMRDRLRQQAGRALPALEVAQGEALYRLYGGPFATRDAAMLEARRMQEAGIAAPMVVQR